MNLIVFLCFLLAFGCFAAVAIGVSTKTNLTAVGLAALTVGLGLALRIFAL